MAPLSADPVITAANLRNEMPSPVFADSRRQVALEFDETLAQRFRCLRDAVAQGVYQRGLKSVAADLDLSPGNLSVALSDDPHRKLGVDELERYIQTDAAQSMAFTDSASTPIEIAKVSTSPGAMCPAAIRLRSHSAACVLISL